MSSLALQQWRQDRLATLSNLEAAHAALEGAGRGRRFRTEQINGAYIVLIAGQFQAFSRRLHSEAAVHLTSSISNVRIRDAARAAMTQGRELDRGNANAGNIGKDFSRLGMDFWPGVKQLDARNANRQKRLDQLIIWRNSIAHQSVISAENQLKVVGTAQTLRWARVWREACAALALQFDRAVAFHIASITGAFPW